MQTREVLDILQENKRAFEKEVPTFNPRKYNQQMRKAVRRQMEQRLGKRISNADFEYLLNKQIAKVKEAEASSDTN